MTAFRHSRLEPGRPRWNIVSVRRKFSIVCLLFAWLCANGAIWNVVQVVGWAQMIRNYSQIMPATQALQVTFDGSAPCKLCHLAHDGRAAAEKAPPSAALGGAEEKIFLMAECAPTPVLVAPDFSWPGVADVAGLARTESVLVPPPRV
jgi:hypothetical protein